MLGLRDQLETSTPAPPQADSIARHGKLSNVTKPPTSLPRKAGRLRGLVRPTNDTEVVLRMRCLIQAVSPVSPCFSDISRPHLPNLRLGALPAGGDPASIM